MPFGLALSVAIPNTLGMDDKMGTVFRYSAREMLIVRWTKGVAIFN